MSRRASFWVSGVVVALALWTSACPTMTNPLYESEWGVSTTTITWIFAAYPLALIPVLIILGDISDHIGRRSSMVLGLLAELLGVLLFIIAKDVVWLFIGRAFMGLGVGLSLSPANVAMVEFSAPGQEKRASAIATGISSIGIALAMVVGGALTEYAPFPLRLNFVALALVIVVGILLVSGLPGHTHGETRQPWRIRPIVIARGHRTVFIAGALAMSSSFLLGAIVLPLGAKIAHQLAGSTNALVTGALLAVFAIFIALTSMYARRFGEWTLILAGASGSIAAVWLYVVTGTTHSLTLFFLGSAVAGAAYAFNFAGGLTVLNTYAAPHHRTSMVSGGYLIGYIAQGTGAPLVGWIVTTHGLLTGLIVGSALFSVFFVAVIVCAQVARRAASKPMPDQEHCGHDHKNHEQHDHEQGEKLMSIIDGVTTVENFWARVWQAGDPGAIDELVHEDFVIVNAGAKICGREAFKTWVQGFLDTVHDLEFTVIETFQNAEGTRVCSLWELTGCNNGMMGLVPDGRSVHLTGTAVWDVHEDGTLLRNRVERNAFELHRRLTEA